MYKIGIHLIILSLIITLGYSCKKEKSDEEIEQEKISSYLSKAGKTMAPTKSGLYYESVTEGTGAALGSTDYLIFKYRVFNLDGVLLETSNKTEADTLKIYPAALFDGPLKLSIKSLKSKGLVEGLMMMKEGAKASMIMPSNLNYYDNVPRIFEVELVKVIHDIVAFEKQSIASFLDTIKNTVIDSASGMYYIERSPGINQEPLLGDTVEVSYTLRFTDGRIIDENPKYIFKIGSENIIEGFTNGVKRMKTGTEATMIIPSSYGYGSNLMFYRNTGVILMEPYSTLWFEVKLIQIY